ncbi:MAG: PEP/pyruvate-binding domain-containing protein [bacterium]|nr:PEP/pyruvate-binding domain-containing protein [bacterium]
MIRQTQPTVVAVLVLHLAALLPGQDPFGGRRGRRGPPPSPVLEALDQNGDGEIDGEEMDFAAVSLLTLDQNGDGNLTAEEMAPPPPPEGEDRERRGRRGPPPGMNSGDPIVAALDLDGDGELFEDEVTGAAKTLDRLDTDDDDVLTRAEMFVRSSGAMARIFAGGMRRDAGGHYDGIPLPSELRREDGAGEVPDMATFREFSYRGKEVMIDTHLADLEFVKFQIESADEESPRLYFLNTNTFRAHPMFMRAIGIGRGFGPTEGRMRGVLVYRPRLMAGGGAPGLFTFEFEPNDAYPYDGIRLAYDLLCEHAPILRDRLAYNLLPRARQRWQREKELYEAGKLPVFQPDDVYGEVGFLPLNIAESFGRLRLMQPGERPSPRDIVVYRSLPNEMPRVAGVLTGFRQTPLSHVNLRAVQDGVPNAYVAGAADDPKVKALFGRYVHYRVDAGGYSLREATTAEVDAYFAALRPKQSQVPPRDLTARRIRAFSEVAFGDAASIGVKGANLATLRTFGFDSERTPDGYVVPFAFYHAFMQHNGFYARAVQMFATPGFQRDAEVRQRMLREFREIIEDGEMPAWAADALAAVQARFPAGGSIRCRSSTNNEDLPGFSGAGLYDSFTHKPSEGHLKKSIQQVFASLWNFRAFEEREFFRIDHMAAAMGVVLHPNYKKEQLNGVAVTRDVLHQDLHQGMTLYYVNAQCGEDLVTNPEAESIPEELLLSPRNPRKDRLLQRSNQQEGDASLLTAEHRAELRRCMRVLHDRFAGLYGRESDAEFAMEIEFKVTAAGELVIKQARPWVD